jgi:hypothetical protein
VDGGAKHHLATSSDVLLPLADVIPVPGVDQVVSVGDVVMYAGIMWVIAAGMRSARRERAERPALPTSVAFEISEARQS